MVSSSTLSKGNTHWIPLIFDPSFTSTNANVFCFLTVLTHPLIDTCSSDTFASEVLTRRAVVAPAATVLMWSWRERLGATLVILSFLLIVEAEPVRWEEKILLLLIDASDLAPLLPILDALKAETLPLLDAATAATRQARDAIFFAKCCRLVDIWVIIVKVWRGLWIVKIDQATEEGNYDDSCSPPVRQ